jgi:hypothetical protein
MPASSPSFPSNISGMAPTLVTTIDIPKAIASKIDMGKPSE